MAKRVNKTRPPTIQTNGALTRIYVKGWRSQPVGALKKALRKDIAEWVQAREAQEGQMMSEETWPGMDAVRHVNQFTG